MVARFHMTVQEVKNCFAKYSNDIMKVNDRKINEKMRKNFNDKEGKLNYVE